MKINVSKKNIAIGGYDVVSYHELIQSPARIWNASYVTIYNWVEYRFRNKRNKETFDANPELYIPQYGGFCATAMSEWNAVPVDPETFLIQDSKLYLFYNDITWNNTLHERQSNLDKRKEIADKNWATGNVKYLWSGVVYSSLKTMIKRLFI